jgi:hypothetical protein
MDDENLGLSWNYTDYSSAVAFDRMNRRIIQCKRVPDNLETGECRTRLGGYKLQEVGERVCKPIPLTVPREGETVRVYTKVYGKSGVGTPGVKVGFSLNPESQVYSPWVDGEIAPSSSGTEGDGEAYSYWRCGNSGVDVSKIRVSTEIEQALPGLAAPDYENPKMVAPPSISNLSHEEWFFPGWWLLSRSSTRVRTKTAAQAFDSLLSSYSPVDEETPAEFANPFFGALLEYSWYDLETSPGSYNWAKVDADVNYLASKGMKAVLAVRCGPYLGMPLGAEAWVPSYITEDTSGLYPASGNVYDPLNPAIRKTGVFASVNNASADVGLNTVYPSIFDPSVRSALLALLLSLVERYSTHDAVTGYVPLDMPCVSSNGVRYAVQGALGAYSTTSYWDARRTLLQSVLSTKPVFEWCAPNIYVPPESPDWCQVEEYASGSHSDWCIANSVGLLAGAFFSYADRTCAFTTSAGGRILSSNRSTHTGILLPDWSWSDQRNLTCSGEQCSVQELVVGGPDMVSDACQKLSVDGYAPWMVFLEPTESAWSAEGGIYETASGYRLIKNAGYYP